MSTDLEELFARTKRDKLTDGEVMALGVFSRARRHEGALVLPGHHVQTITVAARTKLFRFTHVPNQDSHLATTCHMVATHRAHPDWPIPVGEMGLSGTEDQTWVADVDWPEGTEIHFMIKGTELQWKVAVR